jgi:hypothetical protein
MEEKKENSKDHKEVKDIDINLDAFGSLQSSVSVDKLNKFLDKTVDDKKLKHLKKKSED